VVKCICQRFASNPKIFSLDVPQDLPPAVMSGHPTKPNKKKLLTIANVQNYMIANKD